MVGSEQEPIGKPMDLGTILTGQFEPESLTPGKTYTAFSDDVAYPILRYMVTAGFATSVWEQFLPEGRVAMTAVAGRENPEAADDRPVEATGRMTLTQKWARDNVLNDYVNWREAWWREAIQNSVDAHATRIKLSAGEQPDGTWLIVAEDDGTGMSTEQMEDPQDGFLVFGGSSKARALGQTGAFGKAKELLVLPWIRWKVETRDKSYSGVMDEWERRSIPYRAGLRVEVVMPADFHTDNVVALAFLEKCWIPNVSFVINGSHVTTKMPIPTDPDAVAQVHDMGTIYKLKRERTAQIYVRKNGIWMFSVDLPPGTRESLLVEVSADSKVAFTQSRDAFLKHGLYWEIEHLKAEITTEKRVLPRRDQTEEMNFYNDRDMSFVAERAAKLQLAIGNLPPITKGGARFDQSALKQIGELLNEFVAEDLAQGWLLGTTDPVAGVRMCDLSTINGQKSFDALAKQLVWFQDFKIIKYPKQPLVKKRFMPGSMDAQSYRLARVWSEMCRVVLMMLGCEREYGIGFMFWDEAVALCAPSETKTYLLINPYVDPRFGNQEILDPSRSDHLRKIYAAAVHECTHFWDGVSKHDDSYAAALTWNFAKALIGERDLFKLTAAIKKRKAPSTSEPKTRGGPPPGEKRKERLHQLATLVSGLSGSLKHGAWESDAPQILQLLKLLGTKPIPYVEEKLRKARDDNSKRKKNSPEEMRDLWESSRTNYGYGQVNVIRFATVSLYWKEENGRMKVWARPDGSRLVNMWNQMIEYVDSLPVIGDEQKKKPYQIASGQIEFARASLMFPDWDADKAPDKGLEEYDAVRQLDDQFWYAKSLVETDWKAKQKQGLTRRTELSRPGDESLSFSERGLQWFIRSLWPYTLEEDTGKSLTMTDDVIRSIANRLAITNQLVTPWFRMDLRWNNQNWSMSGSIVCSDSIAARRWDMFRTRNASPNLYQLDPAKIDVDYSADMAELPNGPDNWKALDALLKLAYGASKRFTWNKPKQEEQVEALRVVYQFLGTEAIHDETLESMLPILAEYGMVGTPSGDDLIITETDSVTPFTFSLAPGGTIATQRWAELRAFYSALQPKTEAGVNYIADVTFEPGTVQQVAAASPG